MFIGTAGQLKAHRQIVEKAMARWRAPLTIGLEFHGWHMDTVRVRMLRRNHAIVFNRTVRAVLMLMIDRWQLAVRVWSNNQDLVGRADKRNVLRMVAAIHVWKQHCHCCKQLVWVGEKIVLGWRSMCLAACVVRWMEFWRGTKRLRRSAERLVLRWQVALLYPATIRWVEHWQEKKRLRRSAEKVVGRWRNMLLALAFDALKERGLNRIYASLLQTSEELEDRLTSAEEATHILLGVLRIAEEESHQLAGELATLEQYTASLATSLKDEKERRVNQAKRGVQRAMRSQLVRAFGSYCRGVEEMRCKRELCERVMLQRKQHRALAGVFESFAGNVEHMRAHREEVAQAKKIESFQRRLVIATEKIVRRRTSSSAMWRWKEHVSECKRLAWIASKVVRRMQRALM